MCDPCIPMCGPCPFMWELIVNYELTNIAINELIFNYELTENELRFNYEKWIGNELKVRYNLIISHGWTFMWMNSMVLAFVIINELEMSSKLTISQLEMNYKLTS